jgi:hypothetical protein
MNANAPFGFRPARHVSALGHSLGKYTIASGLAEDIAIGDLVKSDGNGGIRKAAAGDAFLGSFQGYHIDVQSLDGASYAGASDGTIPFGQVWKSGTTYPAGASVVALVHDDPGETFKVQSSVAITAADIGSLVNLADATPDLFMKASRQTVDKTGGAPSQFRIERILQEPVRLADANNNTLGFGLSGTGNYAILEVKAMKHERGGAAMGVAV